MKKVHFITYSDDNKENKGQYKNMINSKKRILKQAIESGFFDSVKGYNYYDLTTNFKKKYNKILIQPRGAGYWCWKIDIIKQRLDEIDDGDFLIYSDCGSTINKKGINRFNEYKNMLNKSKFGIIYNEKQNNEHELKNWSTKELFNYFKKNVNDEIGKRRCCTAGLLIMQKKSHLYKIINAFEDLLNYNQDLITDRYNIEPQDKSFRDNRHDQAIFTFLFIEYGAVHINGDEIAVKKKKLNGRLRSVYDNNFPFWATRLREIREGQVINPKCDWF